MTKKPENALKTLERIYAVARSDAKPDEKVHAIEELAALVDRTLGKDEEFDTQLTWLLCGETFNIINALPALPRGLAHQLIAKIYQHYCEKYDPLSGERFEPSDYTRHPLNWIGAFYSSRHFQVEATLPILPREIAAAEGVAYERFEKIHNRYESRIEKRNAKTRQKR